MSPQSPTPSSPPSRGITSSPSIFAYQTRLLERTSSINGISAHRGTPTSSSSISHSPGMKSLSTLSDVSAPSTPIRRNVARMAAAGDPSDDGDGPLLGRARHTPGKSLDLMRGKWESKIDEAEGMDRVTPKSSRVSRPQAVDEETPPVSKPSMASLPSDRSSAFASSTAPSVEGGAPKYSSAFMAARAAKRATDGGMKSPDITSTTLNSTVMRPPSLSSTAAPLLSPQSTGNSSVISTTVRTQQVEDTLATARANALARLQARKKAQAEAAGVPVEDVKSPKVAAFANVTSPSSSTFAAPARSPQKAVIPDVFTSVPPTEPPSTVKAVPRSSYKSIVTAPSASPEASRYIPPVAPVQSEAGPSGTSAGVKDKYGSISRNDKRRLGRHLPRIASGGEESSGHVRESSGQRRPSGLSRPVANENAPSMASPTKNVLDRYPIKKKSVEVLAPSRSPNKPTPVVTINSDTPAKRKSTYMPVTPKANLGAAMNSPRPELSGNDMKGLMNAVGGLPVRAGAGDDGEAVTGMPNRMRMNRDTLPPSASSAKVAPAPLPSKRLVQANWMDRNRAALGEYEYLCHVAEAQQWIEGCLDEELGFGVVEMDEGLRDGVVLAKLARAFQGEGIVKSIWTESKHRYKQTDNINAFLKFVRSIGMPETFIFELTDLYNKKNIPKVIFCIHVLSHLLARLGRAERVGNLVGLYDFTEEELAATQKGLKGVAMPNFGDVRNTLAKEASWEPEEPEETEDEKRDRLLLECEPYIAKLQSHLRARLAQMRVSRIYAQLDVAEPSITRLQARARGALSRNALRAEHRDRMKLQGWATRVQAAARSATAQAQHTHRVESLQRNHPMAIKIQAQARGMLARMRLATAQDDLQQSSRAFTGLQAACRGRLARVRIRQHQDTLRAQNITRSITAIQAVLRGRLQRQRELSLFRVLVSQNETYTALQAHLRGVLVRRQRRAHEQRMDDASDIVVSIQAVARGILARQKKQAFTKTMQQASVSVGLVGLQAMARARLAKQSHQTMRKALAKVEIAGSVGGLQAFLRTKLAKKQTTEQKKKLEFVQPDVIGFQAVARGYLARQEYREWRDYLLDPHTQGALVFLQSLIRGFLARRRLWIRTSYIHRNVDQIVKIQALYRGRNERRMYDKLLTGVDVDVPTVQNYMHLLNNTESDFTDQIRTEALRKEVVELIRENQGLETEVQELSTKIALIVKNKMTFEELARAKRRAGANAQEGAFTMLGNHDPFSGAHLDRVSQRKLELFEHLFFTLQTKPDYLARLLRALAKSNDDKEGKLVESVVLILFGFGHERREDYLFHKLLQLSAHMEILLSKSLEHLAEVRFPIIPLASQYLKSYFAPYLAHVCGPHIVRVIEAPELDLSVDPLEIYHRLINEEESRMGIPSAKNRNLDADQVLQTDAEARAHYIRHLQELRFLTDELLKSLYAATAGLPYSVRYLAREVLLALRVKYPDALDEDLTPIVAKTVILPFILPALIAPESFQILPGSIGSAERRNLAAIANLISLIAMPDPPVANPRDRFVRVPLQEYIRQEGVPFRDWVIDVAAVDPLEVHFQTHELFESTLEAKPIMITRSEIYGTLSVLMKHIPALTAGKAKDSIAGVLEELEGPPVDYDRSKSTISLRLTNRLAELETTGPEAAIKEDFVQAKRHVLAVLRVQTGRTLWDVLVSRPEEMHEQRWVAEVHRDIALEQMRLARNGLPPAPGEGGYQIESIRSLPFHEVKCRAIEFCIKLERAGRISRSDHFQGLLVAIASDIRQKHHLRKMQKQTLEAMTAAFDDMRGKRDGFVDQIDKYHQFIDSSMANLQKGKKKPVFLSKQYIHQRHQAKMGNKSRYGTFKYTAAELNEKGILLGMSQFSPRQYDKIFIVIASNEVGVFSLELSSPSSGGDGIVSREEVRMEDLLQAQFDNELNLLLFEGMATFSINMLIHQINKKFYAS